MATTTSILEIVSLIAAGTSIGLAIFAIGLSLVFFFMSHKSASRLENSVDVQRESFNAMYSDTFSFTNRMMDHVLQPAADMEAEIERRTAEQRETIIKEYEGPIDELLAKQETTQGNLSELQEEVRQIVGNIVDVSAGQSRQIEAEVRDQGLRDAILDIFAWKPDPSLYEIVNSLDASWSPSAVSRELCRLANEGLVDRRANTVKILQRGSVRRWGAGGNEGLSWQQC